MKHVYKFNYAIAYTMKIGDDFYLITSIWTQKGHRNKGYAKEVMNQIIRDADTEHVMLGLSIAPDQGTDIEKLINWYHSLGFKVHEEDPNCMIRFP